MPKDKASSLVFVCDQRQRNRDTAVPLSRDDISQAVSGRQTTSDRRQDLDDLSDGQHHGDSLGRAQRRRNQSSSKSVASNRGGGQSMSHRRVSAGGRVVADSTASKFGGYELTSFVVIAGAGADAGPSTHF